MKPKSQGVKMSRSKSAGKPQNIRQAIIRLARALKPWRWAFAFSCFLAVASTLLALFGPKILGDITTRAVESLTATGQVDWPAITPLFFLLAGLYILSSLSSFVFDYIVHNKVTALFAKSLREQIVAKISRLPVSHFDKVQPGDVISRINNDVGLIDSSLSESIMQVISGFTTVVGSVVIMISLSLPLSLVAFAGIAIAIFAASRTAGLAQKFFRDERKVLGEINDLIEEDYTGQQIIKSNSHGAKSLAKFDKVNQNLFTASWSSQFYGALAFPLVSIFSNLSYVAVCLVGGMLAINKAITIGGVQAFIQYVHNIRRPLTQVAESAATIQHLLSAAERVFDFLDQPEQAPETENPQTIAKVRGAVEFHNVNFAYKEGHPVIKNFSVKIEPGSKVAIVGPTGAGKTTLINLLMRFYEPNSGYITIDGVPTQGMERGYLRGLFGMVLQDTWLFSGTILDNLRYGNQDCSLEQVRQVAKTSGLDHFVESLPETYMTKINEDSDNVSAGEKQLLTITRAMLAGHPMMILDEATSNVDTRTEQIIQDAMNHLTRGRTSFVIAHRLSTIRNADLILVMKDGNVVEQGTHHDLLQQNGFYTELYNSQFETD